MYIDVPRRLAVSDVPHWEGATKILREGREKKEDREKEIEREEEREWRRKRE